MIDAIKNGEIKDATIVRVVSSRVKAIGLQRAREADIPTACHTLKSFREQHPKVDDETQLRKDYDKALAQLVLDDRPHLVVCAGYLLVLKHTFLDPLEQAGVPAINIHPALPGEFTGMHAIEKAYQAFKKGSITKTGVMIHYVIAEVDAGKPLVVKELDIDNDETCAQLEERMHKLEWLAIVEGTQRAITNLQNTTTNTSRLS